MQTDRPQPIGGLRRLATRTAGGVGARLRFNRRRRVLIGGAPYHARRRRWYGFLLIPFVNFFLSWERSGVRVLPREAWFLREQRLWRSLYNREVRIEGRALLTPEAPGVPMDTALAQRPSPRAVEAAAQALGRLHAIHETHGDANVDNVLWDESADRAQWIDFDTAHRPRFDPVEARADDLRALGASAMRFFSVEDAGGVAKALIDGYRDSYGGDYEIERAAARLRRQAARPSPLDVARGGADAPRVRALANQLRALSKRGSAYSASM